jgi:hypothetical protein
VESIIRRKAKNEDTFWENETPMGRREANETLSSK